MDPWTPMERDSFVQMAVNSTETKGNCEGYFFNVMPKVETVPDVTADNKRSVVTDTLANVIFNNPNYKSISLKLFQDLQVKIMSHPKLGYHFNRDIMVVMKGSNAYNMLIPGMKDYFPMSDLDFSIFINPFLPEVVFNMMKQDLAVVVKQTMSQFKRTLDHMLFLNKPIETKFMDDDTISMFKADVTEAVQQIDDPSGQYISPFASDEFRNAASRNSFLITNSQAQDNHVVRIELPHFDKCERIPLRKTPLFCSFNETIDFNRDEMAAKKGKFDLYRLRMNFLYFEIKSDSDSESEERLKYEKVTADFIDVSIPYQNDAELLNFWTHGRTIMAYDVDVKYWMAIPDLVTCITELERILFEYECPEHKREKRVNRLAFLKQYLPITM